MGKVIQFKSKAFLELEQRINDLRESSELRQLDKTEVRIILKNSQGFIRFFEVQRNLLRNEINVPFLRAMLSTFVDSNGVAQLENVDLQFSFSGEFKDGMAIYSEVLK